MKDKDDFAVVLQPFPEHLVFPVNRFNTTDVSYLAKDCFHFSQKGYARCNNIIILYLYLYFTIIFIQVKRNIKIVINYNNTTN